MTLETIRRITIRAITQGFDAAKSALLGLSGAQEKVSQSSEKTSRSQLSVANALDRQKRSLDLAYRAQQDYEKSQKTFDRALQQGLIGQQEHTRLMGLARQRSNEVADGTSRMTDGFDRLANTLTRRLIFAAILNEMKQLISYAVRIPALLSAVGDSANRTGADPQRFQAYGSLAGDKGIDTKDYLAGAQGLAAALNESKSHANDLYKLFKLNGIQVKTWEEAFLQVSNLVRGAATEQDKFNILAQANLPVTREWIKLLERGGDELKRAADEKERSMMNRETLRMMEDVESSWNRLFNKGAEFLRMLATGIYGFMRFVAIPWISQDLHQFLGNIENPQQQPQRVTVNTGNTGTMTKRPTTVDAKAQESLLNLERQRIGTLGEIASVTNQVRAKEIELTLAVSNKVRISQSEKAMLLDLARVRAEEQENAMRSANGVVTAEQLRATKERELGVLVRANKLTQDEATTALQAYNRTIEDTINRQKVYNSSLPQLKQLEIDATLSRKSIDELATTSLNGLSTSLTDALMRTRTLGDAFRNFGQIALRAMSELLIKMTIIQPIAASLQASLGGAGFLSFLGIGGGSAGGSALGSLFHSGGIAGEASSYRYVHPSYFDNAPRYHSGGIAGDEIPAILQRGEEVLRRDDPRHRRNGGGGSSVSVVQNFDFRGADPAMRAYVESRVREVKRETLDAVSGVVQKTKTNNPGYFS